MIGLFYLVTVMSGEKRVWLTLVNLYFVIIKYSLGQAVRGSLIWEDNFDTVINRDKWRHVVTGWRGANEEFQYYTNNPSNRHVFYILEEVNG